MDVKKSVLIEPGSYRDRNGRVFYHDDKVYRTLSHEGLKEWENVSKANFFKKAIADRTIVESIQIKEKDLQSLLPDKDWQGILNHELIPFISYPFEWPFGMLKDAALLHLRLLLDALEEDFTLKDASPYNIQWIGTKPIFIDVLSFKKWTQGEPWIGYNQFCQLFLFPLFLQAHKNISFQPWLRGYIKGISPKTMRNILSWRDYFKKGVFTNIFIQDILQTKYSDSNVNVKKTLKNIGFHKELIKTNVKKLISLVQNLHWKENKSEWGNYANQNSYSDQDELKKIEFIENITSKRKWDFVWDLGCNTGNYSRIASKYANKVLAIDSDDLCVEKLYQSLKSEGGPSVITPLTMSLANPSPNFGWRGKECKSLEQRGKPDLILSLALIHHMVISENIPLHEFIGWLASFKSSIIIEYVTKDDPMVKKLLQNKEDIYTDYNLNHFEQCLSRSFKIVKKLRLSSNTRILYYAESLGS